MVIVYLARPVLEFDFVSWRYASPVLGRDRPRSVNSPGDRVSMLSSAIAASVVLCGRGGRRQGKKYSQGMKKLGSVIGRAETLPNLPHLP